jgi:hypothetical protein
MNKKVVVVAIGLLLLTMAGSAQTIHLKATVPFSFSAGKTTFPAGQYELKSLGIEGNILAISGLDSKAGALVIVNSNHAVEPANRTKLIFHRYGRQYFLSEVWVEGNTSGQLLPPPSREREIAKELSKEDVILMAKR